MYTCTFYDRCYYYYYLKKKKHRQSGRGGVGGISIKSRSGHNSVYDFRSRWGRKSDGLTTVTWG